MSDILRGDGRPSHRHIVVANLKCGGRYALDGDRACLGAQGGRAVGVGVLPANDRVPTGRGFNRRLSFGSILSM